MSIAAIIGFFTVNWQRILIYALVAAAIMGTFGTWCYMKGKQALYEYQAEQATAKVVLMAKRGAVTDRVVTQYVKVAGETKIVHDTIEKEVVRYANDTFTLDVAWRRLHDAAALNRLPDPTPGTDAAPTAAQSLATVTENYGACNAAEDRLEALQGWVRAQAGVK